MLPKETREQLFLNFGNSYPKQLFTVVIWESDIKNFKYIPAEYLKGKNICVNGLVEIFKGKPQIIVKSQNQIVVE